MHSNVHFSCCYLLNFQIRKCSIMCWKFRRGWAFAIVRNSCLGLWFSFVSHFNELSLLRSSEICLTIETYPVSKFQITGSTPENSKFYHLGVVCCLCSLLTIEHTIQLKILEKHSRMLSMMLSTLLPLQSM